MDALTTQNEKAFLKQPHMFPGKTRTSLAKKTKSGLRFCRNPGLGFKASKAAMEGNYIDKKCPFTGLISIRGRILRGTVRNTKMKRTVTVRRDYLHYITKYNRYEKRHRMVSVHVSPCFDVRQGDEVIFGECRPLAKTVRFNVLKVIPKKRQALKAMH